MKSQTYLNLGNELPLVTQKEPRLWGKTSAVYEDLKPNKRIRCIDLRKGLNIIWAKTRKLVPQTIAGTDSVPSHPIHHQ